MKKKCVKNEKKKGCSRIGWATAQLCHNTMGNCIVIQHLWACNRLLSVSQYNYCIVTGAGAGCWKDCVAIHQVYCDRRGLGWRIVSQYTPLYWDKLMVGLTRYCVAIHKVVS